MELRLFAQWLLAIFMVHGTIFAITWANASLDIAAHALLIPLVIHTVATTWLIERGFFSGNRKFIFGKNHVEEQE
jgi:hypothetical protein